ncbi:SRPBCC domain-containing protein [Agrococcus terreus]|uniref:SRPBCC domain-containing protein n=1 Tax=Agrococcus terreus TaxID=574649 RepID=UPI00384DF1EA
MSAPTDPGAGPRGARRLVGIDLARLVAIAGMMAAHVVLEPGTTPAAVVWAVDGPPSTLFAVLGGTSVVLASRARLAAGQPWAARRALVARGLVVALIGLLVEPFASAVYVVLVPFGVAIALSALVVAARWWVLLAIAVPLAASGGSIAVRAREALPAPDDGPLGAALGVLLTGVYPVVTWWCYLLIGMLVARALLRATAAGKAAERRALGLVALMGAALLAAGAASSELGIRLLAERMGGVDQASVRGIALANGYGAAAGPEPMWQLIAAPHTGTPADIARTAGLALLVIALVSLAASTLPPRALRLLEPLRAAGAAPLTVYAVHVVLVTLGLQLLLPIAPDLALGWGAWLLQLAIALVIGALLAATGSKGPLERLVTWTADRAAGLAVGARPLEVQRPDPTSLTFEVPMGASRAAVWRALTDPEQLPRWMPDPTLPIVRCEMDVRPGGRYRWVHRTALGELVVAGEYLQVEPERTLQHTMAVEGRREPGTVVTVRLEEAAGGSVVTVHEAFSSSGLRDRAARRGAGVAAASYERLDALLEGERGA